MVFLEEEGMELTKFGAKRGARGPDRHDSLVAWLLLKKKPR